MLPPHTAVLGTVWWWVSVCLFVCPEAVGFMYSPQIPKNQHAKRLKCIRLNQIFDGDWSQMHIEIFRCLKFATNWKLLFPAERQPSSHLQTFFPTPFKHFNVCIWTQMEWVTVTHRFHQIWGEHKENTLWFELESEWVFVCLAVRKLTLFRLGKGFGLIIS